MSRARAVRVTARALALVALSWTSATEPRVAAARPPGRDPPSSAPARDEPRAPVVRAPAARRAAPPASRAAPPAASARRRPRVFRFDALRIVGLSGPNALVLRRLRGARRRPLLRFRRSFIHRVLETLEAPALHRGEGRARR